MFRFTFGGFEKQNEAATAYTSNSNLYHHILFHLIMLLTQRLKWKENIRVLRGSKFMVPGIASFSSFTDNFQQSNSDAVPVYVVSVYVIDMDIHIVPQPWK